MLRKTLLLRLVVQDLQIEHPQRGLLATLVSPELVAEPLEHIAGLLRFVTVHEPCNFLGETSEVMVSTDEGSQGSFEFVT